MSSYSLTPSPATTIVTTNPEADCSAAALADFLDELFAGDEPDLDTVDAASAVRELRDDATA